MPRAWSRAALLPEHGAGVYCLTLTVGGSEIRVADRAMTIPTAAGGSLLFHAGLSSVEPESTLAAPGEAGGELEIPVEVVLPVDLAEEIEIRGHDPSAGTAELAYLPGSASTWEDRIIVALGDVSEPEYGEEGEPVAFSIRSAAYDDGSLIPAASQRCTVESLYTLIFPNLIQASKEKPYPYVFGTPGRYSDGAGGIVYGRGSPGYRLEGALDHAILVAGHHVDASAVWVTDSDGNADYLSIVNDYDDWGSEIAYVRRVLYGSGGTLTPSEDVYWCAWADYSHLSPFAENTGLAGAGSLLRYLLSKASIPVADGRIAGVQAWLDQRFTLGGYIDESVSPWELLRDEILPLLPVALVSGPDGLYPVIWRLDAVESDAVEHLTEGRGCWRTSPVSYDRPRSEIVNSVTVEYAPDGESGSPGRTLTVTPSPVEGDPQSWATDHARVSGARYGLQATTVSTSWIWLDRTAAAVATWLVRLHGFIHRVLTLEVDPEHAWIRPGDVVTYTCPGLSMTRKVGIVRGWAWAGAGAQLEVLLIEDPVRDRRV